MRAIPRSRVSVSISVRPSFSGEELKAAEHYLHGGSGSTLGPYTRRP
jgi:hypothetical protein